MPNSTVTVVLSIAGGVVLLLFISLGLVLCKHCRDKKKRKKITRKNEPQDLELTKQSDVTSLSSVDGKGKAESTPGQRKATPPVKNNQNVQLEKVVVIPPAMDYLLEKTQEVEKSEKESGKKEPLKEAPKSDHVVSTLNGGLGGVSMMKDDPSMRTLIKDVREAPVPRMNAKQWAKAVDEMFEQQEQDLKSGSAAKEQVENVRPVTVDWGKSVIYVMPNGEFTQESETTQSSQLASSSSMHEPVFPAGVISPDDKPKIKPIKK